MFDKNKNAWLSSDGSQVYYIRSKMEGNAMFTGDGVASYFVYGTCNSTLGYIVEFTLDDTEYIVNFDSFKEYHVWVKKYLSFLIGFFSDKDVPDIEDPLVLLRKEYPFIQIE